MAGALDMPVAQFSSRLAAKEPTPGGGSAAALAGALGAGLVAMVCNYTVGREKYADVDEDVEAYGSYSRAQSLPRESEEEQRARAVALDAAMRESTLVPLAVAERCA